MRSFKLLAIPLALTISVSISYGQENQTGSDKEDFAQVAKMLHGVWAGDVDKTAEEIKKTEDPDLEEGMIEMVLERVKSVELEFQNGTFNALIGDQTMVGEWKATAAEKKDDRQTLTINVMPDDSEGVEKNFEIHFLGKKHIKMIDVDDGGPPIVLARKAIRSNDQ